MAFFIYRTLGKLVGSLPPRIGYPITACLGLLAYAIMPGLRRTIAANLRHVLGTQGSNSQVRATVRDVVSQLAKGHYELFRLNRLSIEQVASLVHVEGRQYLEEALAEGRGAIACTAHLGNFDVAGQLPMVYGVPMTIVAQRTRPERLFQYVSAMRSRFGLRLIPSDEPMIGLFRALKRGEIICLGCDRDVIGNGMPVSFFGSPTRLPDGPLRVALRTGAPVVPVYAERMPGNTFVVHIEPQLPIPRTGDTEADVTAGMPLLIAFLERSIAKHPEQWLVASPVWPME